MSREARSLLPSYLSDLYSRFEVYRRLHNRHNANHLPADILDQVPPLTETAYRELTREVLAEMLDQRFLTDITSGTTGSPKLRISTEYDESAEAALARRYFEHLGVGKGDRIVALDIDSADVYNFYGMVMLELGATAFLFDAVGADYAINGWETVDPTVIICVPSLFYRLLPAVRDAVKSGRLRHLRKLICIGEPIDDRLRHVIENSLSVECFSFYGSTEAGSIAGECRDHRGLHILDDRLILSIRCDNDAAPLSGELFWTALHLRDHPLVKYASGDVGVVSTRQCTCGLPGHVLTGIRRRQDHFSLFGHQFDYLDLSDAIHGVLGEYSALRIEIEDQAHPRFKFLMPRDLRSHREAIEEAIMRVDEFGYFVERGFVDCMLQFGDEARSRTRKARRVIDSRSEHG